MPDFGLMIFPTDYSVEPVVLAREAESFGFESLFFPEHTHIPANRLSPWPGGAKLPRHYWHAHDPFVALAAVASATTSLKLGTGIALVLGGDLLEGLAPPADADSLAYHFTLPKAILAEGRLVPIYQAMEGTIPLLLQMTYLVALGTGALKEKYKRLSLLEKKIFLFLCLM